MAVSLNCSVYLFMLKTQKVGWVSNFLGAVQSGLALGISQANKNARQSRASCIDLINERGK